MRASVEWLNDHVQLPTGTTGQQVADALLSVGFETEDVHVVPPTVGPLVVGRVRSIEELTEFKKPIRHCLVEVGPGNGPDGSDEPREIICGARNFAEGDLVVVALPGTVLPGDFAIATRKTYGRTSDGMICSARELGIGTDHDGILVLEPGLEIGTDARPIIGTDEEIVELAVTPDRGYALSIRGLARELGIALDVPATDPATRELPERTGAGWPVTIEDPSGCTRFVTVRVAGVDPTRPSPAWLKRRVQAAGIRSISLAVDVTNYVMVELGQPLHAFDLAKVDGDIVVRRATAGEKVKTLDGQVRTLDPDDLVVTDSTGPISLAGVMGGESTEISDSTTEVLIEAAWWTPEVISRTVRRHRLPSEASRRFERFVDPQITALAAEVTAQLLVTYGGGSVVGRSDVGTALTAPTVELPLGEAERLVGRPYEPAVIRRRLEQLGATVVDGQDSFVVTAPSWRPDLTRPADLVEEVARLENYDSIPSILPAAPAGTGLTAAQDRRRRIADDLASAGLVEVATFPFTGAADFDALGLAEDDVRRKAVRLLNPLDAAKPLLATTLLPGLLDTVGRNLSRGSRELALFEIAQVVLPSAAAPRPPAVPVDRRPDAQELVVLNSALPAQPRHLAAVLAGPADRSGWWGEGRTAGWADAIELARRIGRTAGLTLRVSQAQQLPWHPGRCARISVGDFPIGYAGELHPAVCERLGLPARTAALELDLDALPEAGIPAGPRISPFPPVLLDVALVVPATVTAAELTRALTDGGGSLLESVRLFDVYTGERVADGTKSVAFSLVVRAPDRTLTGAEAQQVRDDAVAVATERLGAVLRD